jgi:hypothetical protein
MAQVRQQNIVGRWVPSKGATGFRLIDYSGRGNHGTLTNMDPASDWVVSGGKGALDFDGVNDYVAIALTTIPPALRVGATGNPGTWAIWVYRTATGGAAYFGENLFYCFNFTSTGATAGVWGLDFSLTGLALNRWDFICVTFNGANLVTGYVNGQQNATATGTSAANYSTAFNLTIGARIQNSLFLTGFIDDFLIFNTALTANEVREIYRRGRGYGIGASPHRSRRSAATTNRRRRLLLGAEC